MLPAPNPSYGHLCHLCNMATCARYALVLIGNFVFEYLATWYFMSLRLGSAAMVHIRSGLLNTMIQVRVAPSSLSCLASAALPCTAPRCLVLPCLVAALCCLALRYLLLQKPCFPFQPALLPALLHAHMYECGSAHRKGVGQIPTRLLCCGDQ